MQLRYGLDGRVDARPMEALNTFLVEVNMQLTSVLREQVVFLVDVTYRIEVENPLGVSRGLLKLSVDGIGLPANGGIELKDDGLEHTVLAVMG